jgi:hypothetical protein
MRVELHFVRRFVCVRHSISRFDVAADWDARVVKLELGAEGYSTCIASIDGNVWQHLFFICFNFNKFNLVIVIPDTHTPLAFTTLAKK